MCFGQDQIKKHEDTTYPIGSGYELPPAYVPCGIDLAPIFI
jgi:hypothetical protein